jgi:plasmid stability protein
MNATKRERSAEDEAFEIARRAVLYHEQPPKPPSEIELLRREVRAMQRRLDLAAEVLRGEHDCGEWDE